MAYTPNTMTTSLNRPIPFRQRKSEEDYKDGELVSETLWYQNGQKSYKSTFKDGGLKIGIGWYRNGLKSEEKKYINSKRDGVWNAWHENGQRKWMENYINGEKWGKDTDWYENGQKKSEGNFIADWYEYEKKRKSESEIKDSFSEDIGRIIKGKKDGKWTGWYDSGQIRKERNYINDKLDGKQTFWDENGTEVEGRWAGWAPRVCRLRGFVKIELYLKNLYIGDN